MENSFEVDGKMYVSSKRLAKKYGYTNDHISRLCRQGKVRGQRIARTWFVDEDDLVSYQSSINGNGWGSGNGHRKKSPDSANAKPATYKSLPEAGADTESVPTPEPASTKESLDSSDRSTPYYQFAPDEAFEILPGVKKSGPETKEDSGAESEDVSEKTNAADSYDAPVERRATPHTTKGENIVSSNGTSILLHYVSLPVRNAVLFLSILSLFSFAYVLGDPARQQAFEQQIDNVVYSTADIIPASKTSATAFASGLQTLNTFGAYVNDVSLYVYRTGTGWLDRGQRAITFLAGNESQFIQSGTHDERGSRINKGMITVPSEYGDIDDVRNRFSDEVQVEYDEDGSTGVVRPVFKNTDGDEYMFMMVPIHERQKE